MRDAIEEEVRTILNNDTKYKKYLKGNLQIGITVSFDTGWNKRSSSNRYDSLSGHALIIGCLSKKIVGAIVSSKMCRVCSLAEEHGEEPSDHVYPKITTAQQRQWRQTQLSTSIKSYTRVQIKSYILNPS